MATSYEHNNRDYEIFEHEMIADWRIHYASACAKLKDIAVQALRRVLGQERPQDSEAVTELEQLASNLAVA